MAGRVGFKNDMAWKVSNNLTEIVSMVSVRHEGTQDVRSAETSATKDQA